MKERYLHCVRAVMDCPSEERERLLVRLGHAVAAYLEDVPDADEAGLIAAFGTPEECAAHLMEECAPGAVAAARQKKNKRRHVIVVLLAALLAIAVGVAAYLWSNGGLVIITIRQPASDDKPWNTVIYDYDE